MRIRRFCLIGWVIFTTLLFVPVGRVLAAPAYQPPLPPKDWPVRLLDRFEGEENDWPSGEEKTVWVNHAWQISDGKYIWKAEAVQDFLWYVHPRSTQATDFYLSFEANLVDGPLDAVYGAAFRISDQGNYIFGIDHEGSYTLFCVKDSEWSTLVDWTYSPAIQPAGPNQITILAEGSHFRIAINDQLLIDTEDDRLASGRVGLAIELFDSGQKATFEFDNFILYAPEDGGSANQRAYELRDAGDVDGAIEKFEEALRLFREAGDQTGEASTLLQLGWTYHDQSTWFFSLEDVHKAQDYIQQGLKIYREIRDREGQAEGMFDLALTYEDLGEYEKAAEYYRRTQDLWRNIGNRSKEAWTLNNLGWAVSRAFEFEAAIQYFQESLALFRQLKDRSGEAYVLGNVARVTADHLGYRKGLEFLHQQLQIYQEIGDAGGQAETLNDLGKFSIILGEYEQGLQYFQQAGDLWRQGADQLNESRSLNNIGVVYSYLGEADRAMDYYEQSLQISMEIGDPWREAIWRSNIGEIYLDDGDYPQAMQYFSRAKEIFEQMPDPRLVYPANNLNNIGTVHQELGEYEQALLIMLDALAMMEEVHDPHGEASVLQDLGKLYLETRDYTKALENLNRSLELWRQTGDPAGEAETLDLIGQVNEAQGDADQALQKYLQAIEVRELILGQVKAETYQSTLAAKGAGVYQRAVRLLVQNGSLDQAFGLSERNRARAFLDSMGNKRPELSLSADADLLSQEEDLRAEITALESSLISERSKQTGQRSDQAIRNIEDQLAVKQKAYEELLAKIQIASPELASLVSVPVTSVADIQAELDGDTTLVAYYLTDSSTLAFVISKGSFHVVELAASPLEIGAAVEGFRALGLSNLAEPHPRSLRELYAWLVAPLKEYLQTQVIGIIPHQALHYLPFAALDDGESYFGDQFVLFQLPSAGSLPFIKAKGGRKAESPLILGNPSTDNPGLPPLTYAAQEAGQVANLFHVQALLEQQASEQALRTGAAAAGVIHLAAHGSLNPVAPQFSRLWLAPEGDQDGRLNLYEVYGLDLARADLVVLSACQTQLGKVSAGDEVTSLNRAFLYSVPTVVSTLWPVDDEATGVLMARFYTHLVEGMGKAEALRAAQGELRSDPEHVEWAHPYYWAAFVLNGDPGEVTAKKPDGSDESSPDKIRYILIGGVGLLICGGVILIVTRRRKRTVPHDG